MHSWLRARVTFDISKAISHISITKGHWNGYFICKIAKLSLFINITAGLGFVRRKLCLNFKINEVRAIGNSVLDYTSFPKWTWLVLYIH